MSGSSRPASSRLWATPVWTGATSQHGAAAGKVAVEVVLTRGQAAKLNSQGFGLTEKRVDGAAVSQRLEQQAASGYTVFRSYGEPGGIKDELVAISRRYPQLTKLVRIGRSVRGQDILAVKVTKDARKVAAGVRRCSTRRRSTPGSGSRRR